MKTAISLPDSIYEDATCRARELGMSRSEFFAVAARRYLDDLDALTLTETIDEALAARPDDSSAAAVMAGHHRLFDDEEW